MYILYYINTYVNSETIWNKLTLVSYLYTDSVCNRSTISSLFDIKWIVFQAHFTAFSIAHRHYQFCSDCIYASAKSATA